jgi:hypothetical protein
MKDILNKYQTSASQKSVARQLVDVAKTLLFSIFSHERFLLILTRMLNVSEKSAMFI